MAIKEFAAKQVAKQILPMVGKMSDKDLGRLLAGKEASQCRRAIKCRL